MRFLGFFCLIWVTILAAFGETTFLIASPRSGVVVRETFEVSIPKSSLLEGSYVGFWANGKFIGAPAPYSRGEMNVYRIHTKQASIPDGKLKLDAVLFLDTQKRSRALKKISINLVVGNHTGIALPKEGLSLHYEFQKNTPLVYDYKEYLAPEGKSVRSLSPINQVRLLYFMENTYPSCAGQEALLRLSPLPWPPKKEIQTRDLANLNANHQYEPGQVLPVYLRLDSRGREVFGAYAPQITYNSEHKTEFQEGSVLGVLNPELWPVFPEQKLKKGESWEGKLLFLDPKKMQELQPVHLTNQVSAQAKFEDVEWELGHPCAKLIYETSPSSEQMQLFLENLPRNLKEVSQFNAEKMTCKVWFDLQTRRVVRMDKIFLGKLNSFADGSTPKESTVKSIPPRRPGGYSKESAATGQNRVQVGSSERMILHSILVLLQP